MKHFFAQLVLLALLSGGALAGDVYTSTGSAGEKVYTDQPAADARKVELHGVGSERQQSAPDAEPEVAFADLSPCEQARHIVRRYDDAEVLAEKTADGETRILDEAEAEAMREKARADVQRLCKESADE